MCFYLILITTTAKKYVAFWFCVCFSLFGMIDSELSTKTEDSLYENNSQIQYESILVFRTTKGVMHSTFVVFVCFPSSTSGVYSRLSPRLSLASSPSDLVCYILLYYFRAMYCLLLAPTELWHFCPLINTFRRGPFLLLLKISLCIQVTSLYVSIAHTCTDTQMYEKEREKGRREERECRLFSLIPVSYNISVH